MESQQRLYNPHLRARLAEGLEALLPTTDETMSPVTPSLGTFHREQLFITHPHRQHVRVYRFHQLVKYVSVFATRKVLSYHIV